MNIFFQQNHRKLHKYLAPFIAITGVFNTATNANALTFDFSYAPGTTLEQMISFETAGQIWSSYLDDDVTVRIHVQISDYLPNNIIGGALPGFKAQQDYTQFNQKLFI